MVSGRCCLIEIAFSGFLKRNSYVFLK